MRSLRTSLACVLVVLTCAGCSFDFTTTPLDCPEYGCGVVLADAPRIDAPSGDTPDSSSSGDVMEETSPEICEGACAAARCCVPELGAAGCVDPVGDPNHCGSCGVVCDVGQRCEGGTCVEDTCEPGLGDCDGEPSNGCETPLDTVEQCGRCGAKCEAPNSTAICEAGACVYACVDGFADCDDAAPGCEADLNDETHCGACDVNCLALPGAGIGTSCNAGVCAVMCDEGFADCDGDPSNGCERAGVGTESCPAVSCKAILDSDQSRGDGLYWLDPDGAGAVEVYCDMTTEGGGWTRVLLKVAGAQTGCTPDTWDWARRLGGTMGAGGHLLSKVFTQSAGSESGATPAGTVRLETGPFATFVEMFTFTDRDTSWEYSESAEFNMQLLSGPSNSTNVSWNFGTFSASKGYYFFGTHIAAYCALLCNLFIHDGMFYSENFAHELFIREL